MIETSKSITERNVSLATMPATELRKRIARREISPVELVEALISRVHELDGQLHAFCDFDEEKIRASAREAEKAVKGTGPLPLLHGIPVAIKDLIVTKGIRTTRGSNLFRDDIPTFDAPVIQKLHAAGGIIFGKTNTTELGWKSAGSNRVFEETRNPWNLDRTPGGSSAGSAVALATGMAPLALGTDGGGSCRMPASFCNTFGYKPSLGRWALFPPAPVGPMSHVGPMSRTVDDSALLYRALSGPDDRDIYSLPPEDYFEDPVRPAERLRIGWSPDLGFMPIDPEVRAICEKAVRRFEAAGCEIVPLDVNVTDPSRALEIIFATGIGSAVRRFPNWREQLDPGLAQMIINAESLTPFEVAEAGLLRATISTQIAAAMAGVDILVTPTVPIKPFPIGQDGPDEVAGHDLGPVRWFAMTAIFNMTGQPVASVPCGFDSDGLPVGLQIVGRRYADWDVFRASKTFEEISPWAHHWPKISGLASGVVGQ